MFVLLTVICHYGRFFWERRCPCKQDVTVCDGPAQGSWAVREMSHQETGRCDRKGEWPVEVLLPRPPCLLRYVDAGHECGAVITDR